MPTINPSKARTQIVDLLGDTVLQALGLKAILEDERNALEKQDVEAIEATIQSKSECVEQLQILDRKRERLCKSWGFESGPEQMQQCMDWCDDADAINSRWQHLLVIAAEGSALNMTNGAIIRVRQQHFESSLSVLRGVTPGSDTYGRSGAEASDFSSRSIAEA